MEPIAYFFCPTEDRYAATRQGCLAPNSRGEVRFTPHKNYEQALEDLQSFTHAWLIYRFHRNTHWKPKVMPPRGGKKRGVFATRSPHRPNNIGLSLVKIESVDGLKVEVSGHDLLDGTPVYDIKPYIPYADSQPGASAGWLDDLQEEKPFDVIWTEAAKDQLATLCGNERAKLIDAVTLRLTSNPYPYPSRRIKALGKDRFELAYKRFRLHYHVARAMCIIESLSGS